MHTWTLSLDDGPDDVGITLTIEEIGELLDVLAAAYAAAPDGSRTREVANKWHRELEAASLRYQVTGPRLGDLDDR